jgi:hypothetical protein
MEGIELRNKLLNIGARCGLVIGAMQKMNRTSFARGTGSGALMAIQILRPPKIVKEIQAGVFASLKMALSFTTPDRR